MNNSRIEHVDDNVIYVDFTPRSSLRSKEEEELLKSFSEADRQSDNLFKGLIFGFFLVLLLCLAILNPFGA